MNIENLSLAIAVAAMILPLHDIRLDKGGGSTGNAIIFWKSIR